MEQPLTILKQYWGYPAFRPMQEDIIQAVLDGKDTLALLPTGGGKSICFQVPALCMEGLCLVITPLIALMKDQVFQLQSRGISAQAIFSGMTRLEIDRTLDNCIYGQVKFLYLSPERLKTDLFLERVQKMKVSMLAIDEAHCISQWGYDFRPPYLEIAEIKPYIPSARLLAVTATATREVKQDIMARLEMHDPVVFQKSFARDNLSYSVFAEDAKEVKLLNILNKVGGSCIVYARSRRKTQEIARMLREQGISADFYHAGLPTQERTKKQENWIQNHIRVMVATNAFGMGIDKPDVRLVVHMDVPESLEAYYQEAGRAGRDGHMAYAVLLYNQREPEQLIDRAEASVPSLEQIRRVYQALANYYQIAVGSHRLEGLPFDFSDFIRKYELNAIETINALEQLKGAGLLQLTEGIFEPARLHIPIGHEELYKFQVANVRFDALVKTVLRLYGGELYQNYLPIRVEDIARLLHQQADDASQMLKYLSDHGVFDYQPSNDAPRLTFLTPRVHPKDLPIDKSFLDFRRKVAMQKARAMVDYMTHKKKCRTRILQAYFDELTEENCGICDFCLDQKKSADVPVRELQNLLTDRRLTFDEIRGQMKKYHSKKLAQALRLLIEEGWVQQEGEQFQST